MLALAGEHSLIQDTVLRAKGTDFASPLIVCNTEHRFLIAEQMRQAGIAPAVCDAIAQGRRPASMPPDETVVYDFASELLETTQVSDATFDAAKRLLGERGVVELVNVMGWYGSVSMLLNVDRYPLPAGATAELQPLPRH